MTEPLPQRPFTALPPPPGGMVQALRDGRRRRVRRRLAGAGAAALSVAVAVGAAVVLGPASTGASDSLVPAAQPSASTSPSPGDPGPAPSGRPSPAATPSPRSGVAGGSSPAPASGGSPAAAPQPAPEPAAGPADTSYHPPDLVRAYHPSAPPPPGQGPSARLCGGTLSNGDGAVDAGAGWCVSALAVKTGRGHDLTIEVCRDRTGPGTLRFPRELEAELTVLDGDRKVWVWSAGRTDERDPHSLDVETDSCWTWTAPWTDVDAAGRPLEIGDYTLSVVSRSPEADDRSAQTTVRIR